MNFATKTLAAATIAVIGALSSSAFAASALTRDDVRAETIRALAAGEVSHRERDALVVSVTSTQSRDAVVAETVRALAAGEVSHRERDTLVIPAASTVSRAQVAAETLEAIRVGAISRHERNSFPTAMQLDSIRRAGVQAADMPVASR